MQQPPLPWREKRKSGNVQVRYRAGRERVRRNLGQLEEIRRVQEKRAEARRDWAEDTIEKEDWLDIKQRTEARISKARREYDRLTGAVTVFGDIPPSDMVRDAWEGWNTDCRRAAVKSVMNRIVVNPASSHAYGKRGDAMLQLVRERT